MAGTISFLAGAPVEVLSPSAGSSANRSGMQHPGDHGVAGRAIARQPTQDLGGQPTLDAKGLAATAAQGEKAGPSSKTTLIFERDDKSGKMYLYIRDKRTGEEVIRIPRKILGDAEPQAAGSRVDIRV